MFLPQKPSQPDTPADTSASENKDEAKKPPPTDTTDGEIKEEAKKPPPTDTTDGEIKEETAKESNVSVSQQPLNCIRCLCCSS